MGYGPNRRGSTKPSGDFLTKENLAKAAVVYGAYRAGRNSASHSSGSSYEASSLYTSGLDDAYDADGYSCAGYGSASRYSSSSASDAPEESTPAQRRISGGFVAFIATFPCMLFLALATVGGEFSEEISFAGSMVVTLGGCWVAIMAGFTRHRTLMGVAGFTACAGLVLTVVQANSQWMVERGAAPYLILVAVAVAVGIAGPPIRARLLARAKRVNPSTPDSAWDAVIAKARTVLTDSDAPVSGGSSTGGGTSVGTSSLMIPTSSDDDPLPPFVPGDLDTPWELAEDHAAPAATHGADAHITDFHHAPAPPSAVEAADQLEIEADVLKIKKHLLATENFIADLVICDNPFVAVDRTHGEVVVNVGLEPVPGTAGASGSPQNLGFTFLITDDPIILSVEMLECAFSPHTSAIGAGNIIVRVLLNNDIWPIVDRTFPSYRRASAVRFTEEVQEFIDSSGARPME
ncbi:MAG: hypothetical protein LBH13_05750 [Cellulomonadaceae bacterium]|nr:hypothetical protein [Cellulomonadaceae bacterium]